MKYTALRKGYHIVVLLMLLCLRGFGQAGSSNIEFVENKGQWDARVKYMGQLGIGNLFLEGGGYTTLLYQPDDLARLTGERHGIGAASAKGSGGKADEILRSHAYRVRFLGANDQPEITPDKALPGY